MRQYEIVYILDSALSREAVDAKLEAFHAALGGEVGAVDHWGVRPLAYPIRKAATGYYVVVHVVADPVGLPEFERLVKLDEETMRYLVVLNEGQPISGESVLADRAQHGAGGDAGADAGAPQAEAEAAGADDEGDGDGEVGADGEAEASSDEGEAEGAAEASGEGGEGEGEGEASAEGGDDEGEGEPSSAGGEGAASAAASPEEGPRSGPPVFSGARGRRRRHEGPPVVLLNYKDVTTLSRFLTEQGKILPKRTTKVTARFQRQLGVAVKRARHLALLPYIRDHES